MLSVLHQRIEVDEDLLEGIPYREAGTEIDNELGYELGIVQQQLGFPLFPFLLQLRPALHVDGGCGSNAQEGKDEIAPVGFFGIAEVMSQQLRRQLQQGFIHGAFVAVREGLGQSGKQALLLGELPGQDSEIQLVGLGLVAGLQIVRCILGGRFAVRLDIGAEDEG